MHRLTVFAAGESIKNEIRLGADKHSGLNASEGVLENITNKTQREERWKINCFEKLVKCLRIYVSLIIKSINYFFFTKVD